MTKQLLSLASYMKRVFIHEIEYDLRSKEIRAMGIREQIICLNETEAAFVALETRRLLRAQQKAAKHHTKSSFLLAQDLGKIAYAVYM